MKNKEIFYRNYFQATDCDRSLRARGTSLPPPWDQTAWPHDDKDHIFLGRAIKLYGERNFASPWTGSEILACQLLYAVDSEHSRMPRYRKIRLSVHQILSKHDPSYIACPLVVSLVNNVQKDEEDYDISELMWLRVRDIVGKKAQAQFQCFFDACIELLQMFMQGKVQTFMRTKSTISFDPIPPERWRLFDAGNVFYWYQVDPQNLSKRQNYDEHSKWIFVSRKALSAVLKNSPAVSAQKELQDLMSGRPDDPTRKEEVREAFKIKYPRMSERRFNNLWSATANKVAPAWSRSGRRRNRRT